ncbi:MAG: hypothetical protein LBO70_07050 [Clostridiales Family XIII bacterium]|jgi:hypothetical protein|nr:hypothetical protein [Clostridiales Family XIII bacterium]
MKQFIVLMAMIAFGIFLYGVIAGADDTSLTRMSGKALYEAERESIGT